MAGHPAAPEGSRQEGVPSVPSEPRSTRVLLVEDEDIPAEMYSYRLLLEGFSVSRARDGAQAISMVANARPDVVLLDPHLPDMQGMDVLEQLCGADGDPLVIVLDREDDDGARRRSLELGAQEWVPRSEVGPGELSRVIRSRMAMRVSAPPEVTAAGPTKRRRRRSRSGPKTAE